MRANYKQISIMCVSNMKIPRLINFGGDIYLRSWNCCHMHNKFYLAIDKGILLRKYLKY